VFATCRPQIRCWRRCCPAGAASSWHAISRSRAIESREKLVRRFLGFTNEMPWRPAVQHVDEFLADLRAEHSLRQSTVRTYQNALRLFCAYLIEPAYGWDRVCEQHFGTHPTQVCFDWNTAAHTQDNEQDPRKRAFTRPELQAFFDRADAEVARTRSLGRKGWLPAMRDAVLFKTAYAWGLRRNEVAHLQSVDFARNPHAREFGRYGLLHVRHGKAHAGSAPKRRSVLTVFDWSSEVVGHWIARGLPLAGGGLDLFPSERGTLVSTAALSAQVPPLPRRAGPGQGTGHAFVAPLLHHPPHRGRHRRRPVRPAAGRPRPRLDDRSLHLRLQRLPHQDPARSPRHDDRKGPERPGRQPVKRDVDYTWRLAEVMARAGMHNSTDLAPLLRERGIDLSASQVYRVVTQRPERVSLKLLSVTEPGIRRPRGRPRTTGDRSCDRCGRATAKIRVRWPDGNICGTCFTDAASTYGPCDRCQRHRMTPGRRADQRLCRVEHERGLEEHAPLVVLLASQLVALLDRHRGKNAKRRLALPDAPPQLQPRAKPCDPGWADPPLMALGCQKHAAPGRIRVGTVESRDVTWPHRSPRHRHSTSTPSTRRAPRRQRPPLHVSLNLLRALRRGMSN